MSDTVIHQDPELTFAADELLDVIEDEKAGVIAGVSLWYAHSLRKAFECGVAWEQGHERADGPGEASGIEPRRPVVATREKVKQELLEAVRGILSSCVTRKALDKPSEMTLADIDANIHLYERAGIVFVALRALNGYDQDPRGFEIQ
jgi:hypothetical protein